jgi:hypothetical protein
VNMVAVAAAAFVVYLLGHGRLSHYAGMIRA